MKHSVVTCGECGEQTAVVAVRWPPEVFWCPSCGSTFAFQKSTHTDAVTWQLEDKPETS